MPKVASLGHVGLYVRDIERSKAFYRDIVGLKISDENPKTGSAFMTAKDRLDEHHELLLIPGREDGKVVQQISFRCSSLTDVKEFYRLFLERKVPIIRTVSHGNAVGLYFEDPDGNQLEVYWPTGIDWPSRSANLSIWQLVTRKSWRFDVIWYENENSTRAKKPIRSLPRSFLKTDKYGKPVLQRPTHYRVCIFSAKHANSGVRARNHLED